MRRLCAVVWVLGCLLLSGCGNLESGADAKVPALDEGAGYVVTSEVSDTLTLSQDTPEDAIRYQLRLIQMGRVNELRACFTERLRSEITEQILDKAQTDTDKFSFSKLVHRVVPSSDGKQAKIQMKNGSTLTTLISVDGQWLADTIWFR